MADSVTEPSVLMASRPGGGLGRRFCWSVLAVWLATLAGCKGNCSWVPLPTPVPSLVQDPVEPLSVPLPVRIPDAPAESAPRTIPSGAQAMATSRRQPAGGLQLNGPRQAANSQGSQAGADPQGPFQLPPPDPMIPVEESPLEILRITEIGVGITLNEVIAESLGRDPTIQEAAERIEEAGGQWITASLRPNPTVSSIIMLLPLTHPFTPEREGGPPQYDLFFSYPIDWYLFGKRVAAMESARWEIDVAGAESADTIRVRVAETIEAYYEVLESKALLEIARQDVEILERMAEMTEQLVELGEVASVDLERVRLELIRSRRELREARLELAVAKARLQGLLGRDAPDPRFDVVGTLDVAHPALPVDFQEALQLAFELRPDLMAQQRQMSKAEADLRVEMAEARPEVNIEAGYSIQYQRRVLEMPNAHSWGAGVEMTLPFFDRNQGGVRSAQSLARQAQWALQAKRAEVRQEVEEAVESFRQAHGIITTEAPEEFEAARTVLEKMEAAYQAGDVSLLELLDAERAFRETSRLFINGHAAYWQSVNRLNAAVGGRVLD